MAEETSDIELGEYSVEVAQENVENICYVHSVNGEVSYYTVTADPDCMELVEFTGTVDEQCEDVGKDEITILTADGQYITDGLGQLMHRDVDGTDAATDGQSNLVLNLAHPMGMHIFYW